MKRIILLICIIVVPTICLTQELSSKGRAHFKAAMALFEVASSIEDYKQVAQEFEMVTKSDPNYPDTYINLCKIYGRIGTEEGNTYFSKAQEALSKYHTLVPNDMDTYDDEMVILNSLKEKYQRSFARYTGKWKYNSIHSKTWLVDIQYSMGEYSITINEDKYYNSYKINKIDKYTFEIIYYRKEYKKEKYAGDCDSDADSGYPKHGEYYYDYEESEWYDRITLKNNAPHYWRYKLHREFFLNGYKTYSETADSNSLGTGESALVRY